MRFSNNTKRHNTRHKREQIHRNIRIAPDSQCGPRIAVHIREQNGEEQKSWDQAVALFLTELVRQQLCRRGKDP